MVTINLFPWRAEKKKYEAGVTKKIIFFTCVAALLIVLSAHYFLIYIEKKSQQRMEKLEDELQIVMLEKRITATDGEDNVSITLIKKMNLYRTATINLLLELTKAKQKTVCFTEMTRVKNNIYFAGYARSSADFTEYLKNWPAAKLFSEINIETLQLDPQRHQTQFRFQAIENHSF